MRVYKKRVPKREDNLKISDGQPVENEDPHKPPKEGRSEILAISDEFALYMQTMMSVNKTKECMYTYRRPIEFRRAAISVWMATVICNLRDNFNDRVGIP
jgi:hypothetical protein